MKKRHLLSLLALGISTACYGETYPAPIGPSQSDFGGVGLLQTPTARMAREGRWRTNASSQWFRSPPSRAGISTNHALISISIRC
ncbi:YjbH domain-containing protein [Shigella flexneri]